MTNHVTLINRPDYSLTATLKPNLKGPDTLSFESVWRTSNKLEPVRLYSVTLDREALSRLAHLIR